MTIPTPTRHQPGYFWGYAPRLGLALLIIGPKAAPRSIEVKEHAGARDDRLLYEDYRSGAGECIQVDFAG